MSANQVLDIEGLSDSFSLKLLLGRVRNYMVGRMVGATRDEALLAEVVKFLFCKLYLRNSGSTIAEQDDFGVAKEYRAIFSRVKEKYPEIFLQDDEFLVDPSTIRFLHTEFDHVDILRMKRDPIGDAYEIFVGNVVRGQEGQFFTPLNAAGLLVSAVNPKPGERILDPACGAGGFLVAVVQHFFSKGYSADEVTSAVSNLFGVDKDDYLTKLARIHVASLSTALPRVVCTDSLVWDERLIGMSSLDAFDVILTNPPFGSNIVAGSRDTVSRFRLAYKWQYDRSGEWHPSHILQSNVPPQVLFLEQSINLVKPGGRIGIVVPESLLSSKKYGYVVQHVRERCEIHGVFGMPEVLFKTSGKGGTHTKTCLLVLTKKTRQEEQSSPIFFAEAKWCGHDSRGKEIPRDDLEDIGRNYENWKTLHTLNSSPALGYLIDPTAIEHNILGPRYYDRDILTEMEGLIESHDLIRVADLMQEGVLQFATGDEVGKLAYGTGPIPFVRTSDVSNWEIKIDAKHGVSREIYESYKAKQDVRPGDILMVRDGTYLIGTCAMVTKYDTEIVYQSHLYKIRVQSNGRELDSNLLLAILSSEFVQKQIRAKSFTQDIIDSLGDRIKEVVLPIPKNQQKRSYISSIVSKAIHDRIESRELSRTARIDVLKQ